MRNGTATPTLAHFLAETLAGAGVERMFGVPGGGSSLDVIAAAAGCGIDFVLTGTETAGGLMASVTAELTGAPGVLLTGIGPGAASGVNAAAYAHLEKASLWHLTDARTPAPGTSAHQVFDQPAVYAPVTRLATRLAPETAGETLAAALAASLGHPRGPVHLDLAGDDAAMAVAAGTAVPERPAPPVAPDPVALAGLDALLAKSRRPAILAGLDTRSTDAAAAVVRLAETLGAPVLTSYKAKGVIADDHPLAAGLATGAAAEARLLADADLILLAGFDPMELIPQRWRYACPVGLLAPGPYGNLPVEPAASAYGNVAAGLATLAETARPSDWNHEEIAAFRAAVDSGLDVPSDTGISPAALTRAVQAAFPAGTRAAVDAGAHMFAAMTFWRARAPHDVLKSNGLSTMGFALPAAIASTLAEPARPVVALTGDGGMSMMLAELATAARLGVPVKVVVYNDARLSLIDIKQQRRQEPSRGTRYPRTDFAAVAEGMGVAGFRAGPSPEGLQAVLAEFAAHVGPALVDIAVDPSGYPAQLEALRG
jgi:acetolactate synthase I/II/III large subunit